MVKERVIAVTGAVGGAGTSVAAAATALGLIRQGSPAAVVDLDLRASGIETLLGIEEAAGARWPDLSEAKGDVDGESLIAALPHWRGVPVVSGRRRCEEPAEDVVLDVCTAIVRAGRIPVLDLPRPSAWTSVVRPLLRGCDTALIAVPLTFPGAAGAELVRDQLVAAGVPDVRIVARGPVVGQVDADALASALRLPVGGVLRHDRRLPGAVERGEGPPAGRRNAVGRFAEELAVAL